MTTAREQVESWLTETLDRNIYMGRELVSRLQRVQETLSDDDEKAYFYINDWIKNLQEDISYRAVEAQNHLLDLWALVVDFQSIDIPEESLVPSAG